MRLRISVLPFLVTFFATSTASQSRPSLQARQDRSSWHGTIANPTALSVVSSGETFDFSYLPYNWCHLAYTPVTIWLTDYEPVWANVTSDGVFLEGAYSYLFGDFTRINLPGLPTEPATHPLPKNLTFPFLNDGEPSDRKIYLAVVERDSCASGNIQTVAGYILTTIPLVLQ